MTDSEPIFTDGPDNLAEGKCPGCGQAYNVIVADETIYLEHEAPLPDEWEVRPPDYAICICGTHLWLTAIKAFTVTALFPIPSEGDNADAK